ncbi:MAG: hypothetical protein CVU62_02325 [Deltaproteobacteria bacterium HGW-Deltaproteobacteria-2]|jgi:hypothetical protein|nr:MAG: hypothetical protein CVU62_02325 [Deltaproteobacteria bacterium HGW-Deltaproteobacteria-2]
MPLAEKLNKQQLHKFEELEKQDLEGWFEAGEARPSIPEGLCKVCYIKYDLKNYYGTTKIYLWFQIIEPYEYEGIEIFMAMNAFKKVPPGSKYYKQWVLANNNINPARKDRMSPSIFKNGTFKAHIKTITKNKDGSHKKNSELYSVIDSLIEKLN